MSSRAHRVVRWLTLTTLAASAASSCSEGAHAPSLFDVPPGDPPRIPVGLDAYRYWDRLPYVQLGARAYMRSTFDRAGGNEGSDASHFLRETAPGNDVALDVAGSGFLTFFRANHWHGSPWHYVVDGDDIVVAESSTATPNAPVTPASFIPSAAFPAPLALTWDQTQGGDVSWVPIGFERSFSLNYGRAHYGTGYYIYSVYDPSANLTQPVKAWDGGAPAADDVLALLSSAGSDRAPSGDGVRADAGAVDVPAGATTWLVDLAGPATLRMLRITAPTGSIEALAHARLRVTWDGLAAPSVDAPVPLFFGTGTFVNRTQTEYLVKSLPATVRFSSAGIELSMYFPMPFQRTAHVEIVADAEPIHGLSWQTRSTAYTDSPNAVGYFHATYRDHGIPELGQDLVLLDTTQTEGGGDRCGSFVGTSVIFSDHAFFGTLEGDPRFFFDDSQTPQAQGTGTEELGAGGDYWGGNITTLPFAGHPVGAPDVPRSLSAEDQVESMYRFFVGDAFPFGKNARIQLEHGGMDDNAEHYRTVAYWYGANGACLVQTDALHVGDAGDEAAHAYVSPDASEVETITSRYELGVDHLGAAEPSPRAFGIGYYPAETDSGRHTQGTSELSLSLRPDNFGVLLRRKLDYAYADQRADVFVADDTPSADFIRVGSWYTAGSTTGIFENPSGETEVATPTIQTSNRRFVDDELLLPRALTRGRSRIRVRFVFTGQGREVAPGQPAPRSAWSEIRYTAYSYVMPPSP